MALLPTDTSNMNHALMHVLVMLFGIGAWVAINGVWVELPVLVEALPEKWGLPSYLVILIQVANLGPLVVTIMQGFFPRYYHPNVLIYIMLILETMACFLLIFVWHKTVTISGTDHSVPFFVLFLILGFADCTSSVTSMPYVRRFQYIFITTYFIGEGLSGFVPSVIALAQGTSQAYCVNVTVFNNTTNATSFKIETRYEDPRFSAEVFFACLFLMMVLCSVAFSLLNHSQLAMDYLQQSYESDDVAKSNSTEMSFVGSNDGRGKYTTAESIGNKSEDEGMEAPEPVVQRLGRNHYFYFYGLAMWISCISNGVMPSVTSYSSLPYGQLPYHFAATLGAMANPLACFIALFLPVHSHGVVGLLTAVTTGFASYLMFLAVQSPCPVLVNSDGGAVLMVISQIFFVFTTSYAKVSIGQILRERGSDNSLVWYGAFTQLGSLVGGLTMFPLVNVYYYFQSGDPCTTLC